MPPLLSEASVYGRPSTEPRRSVGIKNPLCDGTQEGSEMVIPRGIIRLPCFGELLGTQEMLPQHLLLLHN